MEIFVELKILLKFVGVLSVGKHFLLRRVIIVVLFFYGIIAEILYLALEASTFTERAQSILFLNALGNGASMYLLCVLRQEIFNIINDLQRKIECRKYFYSVSIIMLNSIEYSGGPDLCMT